MMFCVAVIIVALFIRRYKIDESHRVDPMSKGKISDKWAMGQASLQRRW